MRIPLSIVCAATNISLEVGCGVLFQPCRTGRLGRSVVSGNLVVDAMIVWWEFFPDCDTSRKLGEWTVWNI